MDSEGLRLGHMHTCWPEDNTPRLTVSQQDLSQGGGAFPKGKSQRNQGDVPTEREEIMDNNKNEQAKMSTTESERTAMDLAGVLPKKQTQVASGQGGGPRRRFGRWEIEIGATGWHLLSGHTSQHPALGLILSHSER